jgi:hypothetical protein
MGTINIEGKDRKITTRKDGYQVITLQGKTKYLHRHLAEQHLPNPNNLSCVNHIDGNPSNNSIDNLEWVSYLGNAIHARQTGLWGKNILSKRKFTIEQAEEIRNKYIPRKYSIYKLAKEYNVDSATIWAIVNNKSYTKEYLNK